MAKHPLSWVKWSCSRKKKPITTRYKFKVGSEGKGLLGSLFSVKPDGFYFCNPVIMLGCGLSPITNGYMWAFVPVVFAASFSSGIPAVIVVIEVLCFTTLDTRDRRRKLYITC
jgi:hypothetical protein